MSLLELAAAGLPDIPDDYVGVIGQLVAVVGTFGAAILGVVIAWLVRLSARLRRMEARDRLYWVYTRSLIDYAYRHADVTKYPLPGPPEGLLDPEKSD